MKNNSHSFYCGKKGCLKTAWATPEYLTSEDWALAKEVVSILEQNSGADAFIKTVYADHGRAKDFFHRVIGWPEAYVYCLDANYVTKTGIPSLIRHTLPQLKQAIISHDKEAPKREYVTLEPDPHALMMALSLVRRAPPED